MNKHWLSLSKTERFQIALSVARRRGPFFTNAFKNVISVGAGFRLSGRDNDVIDEICLSFKVRRKWTRRRKQKEKQQQEIPKHIAAYPKVNGKRIKVLIPTDVAEFKGGEPHAYYNLTSGIKSRSNSIQIGLGCACCIVRNASMPNEKYLLSCYHVFSSTLNYPPQAGIDCISDDSFIGPLSDAAHPFGIMALDAALIQVANSSIKDVSIWGLAPTERATDFDISTLPMGGQLFVLGRKQAPAIAGMPQQVRLTPISATFCTLIPNKIKYPYTHTAGRSFEFSDTIEYKAAVRPGDSGAALVDIRGKLYGMHFFGRPGFGYAFAIPRLFDPGVFPFDITL